MQLKIDIDTKRVLAALLKAPEIFTREIRVEMKKEMTAIQRDARANHRYTSRSGNLDRSIDTEVSGSGFSGRVFLNERVAKYGKYVHSGTGIYGPRRRMIKPVSKKFLKFTGQDGRDVFAREVKGQRPDPFLFRAFDRRRRILTANINKALQRGFQKAGV